MCGIAGIIGVENSLPNLERMLESMHHRGPDDFGTMVCGNAVLGHKRLSIIDLSPAGHQPMTNSDGDITIVFNGEIYNYQDLKSFLPNRVKLKSNTDTEVILELWKVLGTKLFSKLRGMFAIAIWDHQKNELVLARDHMGIKPLYFQTKNDQLVFASELKGMLASGLVAKSINSDALNQYLANGYIMQPATILESVEMLAPATYLTWNNGNYSKHCYWSITDKFEQEPKSEKEAITLVQSLITASVNEEAIADRPLGVFLSGGLDSTVLVAALKKSGKKNIQTFSVGFDGDELSEENEAKEAANFYGTTHTQLQVSDRDVVPHIEQYFKAIDQPSIDGLNTWLVSKVTAKHVTVALSGLGGDELFSGYSIDRAILYNHKYTWLFNLINRCKPMWKYAPKQIKNRLEAYSNWRNLPEFYKTWGRLFSDKKIAQLTNTPKQSVNQFNVLNLQPSKFSLLQRISYMHQRGFMMSRLLRDSDAVSMDHSIEVRFPIIDSRVVNLSFNLPDHWKIKRVEETVKLTNYEKDNSYEFNGVKHLLYQAFKDELPTNFGQRPKRGFKMPIEKWMKQGLKEDIKTTLTNQHSFLKSTALNDLYQNWEKGNEDWAKVWLVYTLEKWVKLNLG